MSIYEQLKGALIVSCQALEHEPLHSSFIMSKMAKAAMEGGAKGIRANGVADILAIKKEVDLPIIGIIKREYADCDVFITPTLKEVDELVTAQCDIIAMDGTNRPRPEGKSLENFFQVVKAKYPNQLFMADCATYEEGMNAAQLGFDFIGSTLTGYTKASKNQPVPDFEMIARWVNHCEKPVIAEGNIWTPQQLQQAKDCGIFAAVVGSVITRPQLITARFAKVMEE